MHCGARMGTLRFLRALLPIASIVPFALAGCALSSEDELPEASNALAAELDNEPAYCAPATFRGLEVAYPARAGADLDALKVFQVGSVTVAGLGVGKASTEDVKKLAQYYAPDLAPEDKYCTFYFNDGDKGARSAFNWYNLPKPSGSNYEKKKRKYSEILAPIFDEANPSFLSCAEKRHFLAMGCDGMKHRGPTAFAMFLAYAGCSAENAVAIVDGVWGTNGIKSEMRRQLASWAIDLRKSHADEAVRLRKLFETGAPSPTPPSP